MPKTEPIEMERNGWRLRVVDDADSRFVGLFTVYARKGDRFMHVRKLDAHEVDVFDPDTYWKRPL